MKNGTERRLSTIAVLIATILASASLPTIAATAKQNTAPVTGHKPVAAPTVDNTAPYVGDTVTVDPKFSDADGDAEDTSAVGASYQWQAEDAVGSGTFSDISGATGKTYAPVAADKGKKLVVKVTPRTDPAISEPAVGDEVVVAKAAEVKSRVVESIEAGGFKSTSFSGFPKTIFYGAKFKLAWTGNVASVTADKSWLKTTISGANETTVEITGEPASTDTQATITATFATGDTAEYKIHPDNTAVPVKPVHFTNGATAECNAAGYRSILAAGQTGEPVIKIV